MPEEAYWLALLAAEPTLRRVAKRALYAWCVEQRQTSAEFADVRADQVAAQTGLALGEAEAVLSLAIRAPAFVGLLEESRGRGIVSLLRSDVDYPEELLRRLTEDRIPYYWQYKGDLGLVHRPKVAIVGAGRPSKAAHELAAELARAASANRQAIVGGYDAGVDRISIDASERQGGAAIIILSCGMLRGRDLLALSEQACADGRRLLLSPYPPAVDSSPVQERGRSALAVAMCDCVYVIEPDHGPEVWPWMGELMAAGLDVMVWDGGRAEASRAWRDAGARSLSWTKGVGLQPATSGAAVDVECDDPGGAEDETLQPYATAEEAIAALSRAGRVPPGLAARLRRVNRPRTG